MKRTFFSIYTGCVKTAFAYASAYRMDFVLSLFITLIGNIMFPLVAVLIYHSGASFPGWNFYEVLLVQSIFTISSGLAHLIFGGLMWKTMDHIREGSFEIVLLKPMDPLFFIISSEFTPENIGLIFGGIVLFGMSAANTGIVSVLAVLQFVILFAAGFMVMTGILIIMAATSFKWVGNSRIPEIFDSVSTFGKYPITVFPRAVRGIITFIVPVSMVGFFPASALLGRVDPIMILVIVPCFIFMIFGIWLYHHMIRLYEGVGG
ncbi:MAG: ABC-2 family transporter protein [Lachnoclostridium sp.]|jgi:ABC-2 type transport system permease protein|nr:ABC-2 family transporter protein [Lachnoclostridium sp.]